MSTSVEEIAFVAKADLDFRYGRRPILPRNKLIAIDHEMRRGWCSTR